MYVWLIMHDYSDRLYGIYATEKLAWEAADEMIHNGYYLVTVEKHNIIGSNPEGEG